MSNDLKLNESQSQARANERQEQHPPIDEVTSPIVNTVAAAYYLNRSPQTLRLWACKGTGPVKPIHINGRLGWRVEDLRRITSEAEL